MVVLKIIYIDKEKDIYINIYIQKERFMLVDLQS